MLYLPLCHGIHLIKVPLWLPHWHGLIESYHTPYLLYTSPHLSTYTPLDTYRYIPRGNGGADSTDMSYYLFFTLTVHLSDTTTWPRHNNNSYHSNGPWLYGVQPTKTTNFKDTLPSLLPPSPSIPTSFYTHTHTRNKQQATGRVVNAAAPPPCSRLVRTYISRFSTPWPHARVRRSHVMHSARSSVYSYCVLALIRVIWYVPVSQSYNSYSYPAAWVGGGLISTPHMSLRGTHIWVLISEESGLISGDSYISGNSYLRTHIWGRIFEDSYVGTHIWGLIHICSYLASQNS